MIVYIFTYRLESYVYIPVCISDNLYPMLIQIESPLRIILQRFLIIMLRTVQFND